MGILNGFTSNTPQNLQLDAGVFLKNLKLTESMDMTALKTLITSTIENKTPANFIGATSDGGSFTYEPEMRNIAEDLDGARGNIKGLMSIDSAVSKLSTTIKEMTLENLKMALVTADFTPNAEALTDGEGKAVIEGTGKLSLRTDIKDSDYLENIVWAGSMSGGTKLLVIVLKNVLNTAGCSLEFKDKATGGVGVEFEGFLDLTKPNEQPVEIYIL